LIACRPVCRFPQYEQDKFQATVDRNEAFRTLQWDGVSELNETPSHHDIEIQGIPMKRPSHLIAIFAFQFSFCLASIHGQEAKREPMVPEQGTKFTPIPPAMGGSNLVKTIFNEPIAMKQLGLGTVR
jgi:hypothetical protein